MAKLVDYRKVRSLVIVILVIITTLIGFLSSLPQPVQATFSGPQSTPPPMGNWVINTPNNIIVNETIMLNGNLTIQNGGSLTFKNVTLMMNCPVNGSYYIVVEAGGEFYIYDYDNNTATTNDRSVIISTIPDGHHRFCFQVNKSAKFVMKNSDLYECGVLSPSTLLPIDYTGLTICANNTVLENDIISGTYAPVRYTGSSNNVISNCTIANFYSPLIFYISANNNTVSDCDISNGSKTGMTLASSSDIVIKSTNIFPCGQVGLYISNCDHIDITNCNISSNDYFGIQALGTNSFMNISQCNITNNYYGLDIYSNAGGHISGNSIMGNLKYAICSRFPPKLDAKSNYFGTSNPVQIDEMISGDVDYSGYLTSRASKVTYINTNTQWKDITKYIGDGLIVNSALTLDNVDIILNNPHGQNFIQVNNDLSVLNSDLTTDIDKFTLVYTNTSSGLITGSDFNYYRGIRLDSDIEVKNCELHYTFYGITLENRNLVNNCNFSHTGYTMLMSEGLNNDIVNCNVTKGTGVITKGISVSASICNITNCSISKMSRGIELTMDARATIDNCHISNNTEGIAIYTKCAGTVINGTELVDNNDGVLLSGGSHINISKCKISRNYNGVECSQAFYNNITENSFVYNNGIELYFHINSDFNNVYHNNFYSNNIHGLDTESNNRWNDSYPSGGNFWDDYAGADIKRGPNQNMPGSDGIGDTWYTNINSPNDVKDFYPLMSPYQPNDPPKVLDLNASNSLVYRTSSVIVYSNAEDDLAAENLLVPYIEYNSTNTPWQNDSLSDLQYKNNRWEVMFTPNTDFELGSYNFRIKFMDNTFQSCSWFYFNDGVEILNNLPFVKDLTMDHNTSVVNTEMFVRVNGSDIEDGEDELAPTLEYRDPTGLDWNKSYFSIVTYSYNVWEYKFILPQDAPFGYYDFRARMNDTDGGLGPWLYSNDSLLVYNTHPHILEIDLSDVSVYRTKPVLITIDVNDHETPVKDLEVDIQYHFDGSWDNLNVELINDTWQAWFIPGKGSSLGYYDLRVKVADNESAVHGWIYLNDSIEVLNNLPVISNDLDDIIVGIDPYYIYLASYESDIEDGSSDLVWSLDDTLEYKYLESVEIIYQSDEVLKITSKLDVSGYEDITLILMDKDGGVDAKLDVTVHIYSIIDDDTPKVTLLTPLDKIMINTLTPKFTWRLDYPGTDAIYYNFYIEDNPQLLTPHATWLSSTSYTPTTPLEDGITYYWKVVPTGGICLSEPFSFKIDMDFEPIYKVNLSTNSTTINLLRGTSTEIELKVKNQGNVKDAYVLEVTSVDIQQYLSLENAKNIPLDPSAIATVNINISIPKEFEVGTYQFRVTATSITEKTVTDELSIFINVCSYDIPIYEVKITATPVVIETSPGKTETIKINISNLGNVEDTYSLYFLSSDFTDQEITLSKKSFTLTKGEVARVTVTIAIPQDLPAGEYFIWFYAESAEYSDNVKITVNVQEESESDDGGSDDDMGLYIGIGIVIIIIVVIAILLFIFVIRKKPTKDRQEVQEAAPQEVPVAQVSVAQYLPPPPPPPIMVPMTPPQPQQPVMPPQQPQYYYPSDEPSMYPSDVGTEESVEE